MVDAKIQRESLEDLGRLSPEAQRRVLGFVRRLLATPSVHGTAGTSLLSFAGMIPPDDCQQMAKAIEAACETVMSDDCQISS